MLNEGYPDPDHDPDHSMVEISMVEIECNEYVDFPLPPPNTSGRCECTTRCIEELCQNVDSHEDCNDQICGIVNCENRPFSYSSSIELKVRHPQKFTLITSVFSMVPVSHV
eukprot:GHVU01187010.1.p1 GENE.GHVU01187010.1~~GHVU01187010.1.p1  ORF type:complete len:111 (-),score=4.91 GHVU01187010.1:937-1269(-)